MYKLINAEMIIFVSVQSLNYFNTWEKGLYSESFINFCWNTDLIYWQRSKYTTLWFLLFKFEKKVIAENIYLLLTLLMLKYFTKWGKTYYPMILIIKLRKEDDNCVHSCLVFKVQKRSFLSFAIMLSIMLSFIKIQF